MWNYYAMFMDAGTGVKSHFLHEFKIILNMTTKNEIQYRYLPKKY